jgi:hypothetical protein
MLVKIRRLTMKLPTWMAFPLAIAVAGCVSVRDKIPYEGAEQGKRDIRNQCYARERAVIIEEIESSTKICKSMTYRIDDGNITVSSSSKPEPESKRCRPELLKISNSINAMIEKCE